MRDRHRILQLCMGIGTRYGAVLGALYCLLVGLALAFYRAPRDPAAWVFGLIPGIIFGLFGLGFGASAGWLCGALAGWLRSPAGWGMAGAVGAAAAGVVTALGACFLEWMDPPYEPPAWFAAKMSAMWVLVPAGIGALAAAGIGRGLRRGHSRLPLVTELATNIRMVELEERRARLLSDAAELSPADAPAGRGDEASAAE